MGGRERTSGTNVERAVPLLLAPCRRLLLGGGGTNSPSPPAPTHCGEAGAITLKALFSTSSPPLLPSKFTTTCFPYCSFRSTICLQHSSTAR